MIVMPNTEPRTPPPPPAVPVDARQCVADTLTEIAVRLDTRKQTTAALTDLLVAQATYRNDLPDRAVIALIAAAFADSEQTAALLDDLAGAATRLDRHRTTAGHDECCGGNCRCLHTVHQGFRCRTHCENGPADRLWKAQDDLLHHLETLRSLPHLLRAAQDTP